MFSKVKKNIRIDSLHITRWVSTKHILQYYILSVTISEERQKRYMPFNRQREIQVRCQFGNKLNTSQKPVCAACPILLQRYKKMTISQAIFIVIRKVLLVDISLPTKRRKV